MASYKDVSQDTLDLYMENLQTVLDKEKRAMEKVEAERVSSFSTAEIDSSLYPGDKTSKNLMFEQGEALFADDDDPVAGFVDFAAQKLAKETARTLPYSSQCQENRLLAEDSDEEVYATDRLLSEASCTHRPLRLDEFLLPAMPITEFFLKQFKKNNYNENIALTSLSLDEVTNLRTSLNIDATGVNVPKPVVSFAHLQKSIPFWLMESIRRQGFSVPTPIQSQAFPTALCGRDIIGIAATGSGKTLAYLLPLIVQTLQIIKQWDDDKTHESGGPYALTLCPTRELAIQIDKELRTLIKKSNLRSTLLVGGMNKTEQFRDLKKGVHIVTANPGRLIDLGRMKGLCFDKFICVVLDEADRMLSMGMEKQVLSILKSIRPDRQLLLFSATFPSEVESLARNVLTSPVRIVIGEAGQVAETINQELVLVKDEEAKWEWITGHLYSLSKEGKVFIFCNSQARALKFSQLLDHYMEDHKSAENLMEETPLPQLSLSIQPQQLSHVVCLYGDMDQTARLRALKRFSKGFVTILVASDVASRGLDIPTVEFVINYDCATSMNLHTNRIGRTGRAGKTGKAFTLLNRRCDVALAAFLVESLEASHQPLSKEVIEFALSYAPFRTARLEGLKMPTKSKKSFKKENRGLSSAGLGAHSKPSSVFTRSSASQEESASANQFSSFQSSSSLLYSSSPTTSTASSPSNSLQTSSLLVKSNSHQKRRWDNLSSTQWTGDVHQMTAATSTGNVNLHLPTDGKVVSVDDELSSSSSEDETQKAPARLTTSGLLNVEKRRLQKLRWVEQRAKQRANEFNEKHSSQATTSEDHSKRKKSRWDISN